MHLLSIKDIKAIASYNLSFQNAPVMELLFHLIMIITAY